MENCGDRVNACLADQECSKAQDCAMVPAYGDDDRMMPCAQPSPPKLPPHGELSESCRRKIHMGIYKFFVTDGDHALCHEVRKNPGIIKQLEDFLQIHT